MTDWLDVKEWGARLRSDEEFRDDHLACMDAMIQAASGPHYSVRAAHRGPYMPENHYHSYTTRTVPDLIFDNPRVRCRTRRPGSQMETAEAIRHGLNRWTRDENLRLLGQQLAVDMCYTHGWAMVRQVPSRFEARTIEAALIAQDGKVRIENADFLWPSAYRIPQPQVIVDSHALTMDRAAYMGHKWYAEADSLMAEAKRFPERGWNVEAIIALAPVAGMEGGSATTSDPSRRGVTQNPPRKEVELATIWVAGLVVDEEKTPDKGYNGALLTIGRSQGRLARGDWKMVKEPESYFGPKGGPYVCFGAYTLPNRLYPLSPLVSVEAQIRELNRHARALSRSAEKHKRVVFYDYRDKATAQRLQRAQHDFYIGIPGFDKAKFAEAEIGGATDAQRWAVSYLQDRLRRASAMDESQEGNVTGLGTATEHSIANESMMARRSFLRQQFSDSMTRVLEKVAHFLYYDDRVVFPLGEEAADDFGMEEPWFRGGQNEPGAQFEDLELEIEAYSMQRADQQAMAAKTQAGLNWLIQTASLRPQMPFVDWERVDDLAAQVFDLPDLAGLVDNEAALEAAPFQDGGQEQQPRLQKDVGSQRLYSLSFRGAPQRTTPSGPAAQGQALSGAGQGMKSLLGGQVA